MLWNGDAALTYLFKKILTFPLFWQSFLKLCISYWSSRSRKNAHFNLFFLYFWSLKAFKWIFLWLVKICLQFPNQKVRDDFTVINRTSSPFRVCWTWFFLNNSLLCQCCKSSSLTVLYMRYVTHFLWWYRIFLALVPLCVTVPKSGISLPLVHLSTLYFLSNLHKHVLSLFVFFYFSMLSHQP